ncbi:hypothetical protein [Herbidospora mongoliensis]|uniref:hypothetical protein n=1 Tax=Herbidospora mongoliensis TaxID=688067 RepID=UPI000A5A3DD0|nr:hypothetical protein [Herbidospora mongoliensis]
MGVALPSVHGPHVPQHPQPQPEKLHWRLGTSTNRCTRERVISHTCECRTVLFELRAAGGVYYIRRTDRTSDPVGLAFLARAVWETEGYLHRRALEVWDRLLVGLAV